MYDELTRRKVLMLVERGYTPREISRLLGGKPGHVTIRNWVQGHAPTRRRAPKTMVAQKDKLIALKRCEDGEDYRAVAKELGCSPSALLVWRKAYAERGPQALRTRLDDYIDQAGL